MLYPEKRMSAINQRLSSWGLNSPAARRNITGYIFISPFILGVLIWFLVPAATAGWLTFQKWNLITAPRFVGLDNIENLFEDELFLQSLKVTTMYTLVAVPLGLVLSFFIALLLNTKIRGISIYRTVYYLPQHCSGGGERRPLGFHSELGVRTAQRRSARGRPAQNPLAAGTGMGLARSDSDEFVGTGSHHGDLPGGTAGHPRCVL